MRTNKFGNVIITKTKNSIFLKLKHLKIIVKYDAKFSLRATIKYLAAFTLSKVYEFHNIALISKKLSCN